MLSTKIRIGITGATGALGHRMVEMAVEKGLQVRCLVRIPERAAGLPQSGVELVTGDITDPSSLGRFVTDLDVCIHLAALVGHGTPRDYDRINAEGTENICRAIAQYNPGCRLIHCSTISAIKAARCTKKASTPYGRSKLKADHIVEQYTDEQGLSSTIIYPGLIYGPYDNHFMPVLIETLRRKKVILVSGGEEKGPFIYIDDLCELFLKAAEDGNAIGRRYLGVGNLKSGIHEFIRVLASRIGETVPGLIVPRFLIWQLAVALEWLYKKTDRTDPPFLTKRLVGFFSISFREDLRKFHSNLDWEPRVDLTEGIGRALEWYESNRQCGLSES